MRGFFLPRIAGMGGEGVIERLPINVAGVPRQMVPHARRQIFVGPIWHGAGSSRTSVGMLDDVIIGQDQSLASIEHDV